MKKTILFGLILVSANAFAQTPKSIKLTKGQKISAKTVMSMDMDLGMGTMKTDNNTDFEIKVIDENAKSYTLTYTPVKMKMTVDGMGQNMTYDSDKPEDQNTEIGQKASGRLNVSDTLLLDKLTGEVKPLTDKSNEAKTDGGMLAMSNNQNQGVMDAFLVIPANTKIGDSWSDSTVAKGLTTKRTFKWISSDKDLATIKVTGTMLGSTEQEMQGMSVTMGMDLSFSENRTINIKTGQVISINNDGDMKMTMEQMGMTMSSKIITTTNYSN
jgi:hypothetical protein